MKSNFYKWCRKMTILFFVIAIACLPTGKASSVVTNKESFSRGRVKDFTKYSTQIVSFLKMSSTINLCKDYKDKASGGMLISLIDMTGNDIPEVLLSFPDALDKMTGWSVLCDLINGNQIITIPFSHSQEIVRYKDESGNIKFLIYLDVTINGKHRLNVIEEISNNNGKPTNKTKYTFGNRMGYYEYKKEIAYSNCVVSKNLTSDPTKDLIKNYYTNTAKTEIGDVDDFFRELSLLTRLDSQWELIGFLCNGFYEYKTGYGSIPERIKKEYSVKKIEERDYNYNQNKYSNVFENVYNYKTNLQNFFTNSDAIKKCRQISGNQLANEIYLIDINNDHIPEVLITEAKQINKQVIKSTFVYNIDNMNLLFKLNTELAAETSLIRFADKSGKFKCVVMEEIDTGGPQKDLIISEIETDNNECKKNNKFLFKSVLLPPFDKPYPAYHIFESLDDADINRLMIPQSHDQLYQTIDDLMNKLVYSSSFLEYITEMQVCKESWSSVGVFDYGGFHPEVGYEFLCS